MAISTVTAIPIMTSNTAPSGIASASSADVSFPAYLAFNGVFNATGWRGLGAKNQWLRYDFPTSKAIAKYSIATWTPTRSVKSWTFEGSNDGTIWEVLDTRINITTWVAGVKQEFIVDSSKVKSYKMYRINCSVNNGDASYTDISELEMFEWLYSNKFLISSGNSNYSIVQANPNQNLIPQMTSDTSPSGIARASDVRSGFDPWKSFDVAIDDSYGWTTNNGVITGWLSYQFIKPQQVFKYSIRAHHSVPNLTPRNWTFEGSNNGNNWIVLDVRNNQSFTSAQEIFFEFDNDARYLIYRLNISSVNGGSYINVNRMQIFSNENVSVVLDDTLSEQMFIDYGMDRSTVVQLDSYIGNITKPTKRSEVLGSGKVFKQKIDTLKIPIKKASIT